jgi:mono/diheme cytochrome c family protein
MRKRRIAELTLVVAALAGVILSVGYTTRKNTPTEPVRSFNFNPTVARFERGRYLVEGPAHCFQCHSELDWENPGAQPKKGRKGAGTVFIEDGMDWLIAPNITPDRETGAGAWTDDQFARAIREGIGHDGRRLFPMMPYMNFRSMSDEDLASVVVYLRSLNPVRNQLAKTVIPEPAKAHVPPHQPLTASVPGPDMSDPVARGKYLVTLGNCLSCHTPMNDKGPIMQLAFAGGMKFKGPWGEVTSANITPDASGISYYDEAMFVNTLRTGQNGARKLNSIMPWGYFRNMTDEDLKSIYAYLRTVRPVQHRVDNTEVPTFCEVCRSHHGYGDKNHSE